MSAKRQPLGSGSRMPTCGPRRQQVRTVPAGCFERQATPLSGPASPVDSRIAASLVPDGPRPASARFGAVLAGVRNDAGGCRWRPVSTIGGGINDEVDMLGARPKPRAANMLEPQRSARDSTMAATVLMRNVPCQEMVINGFWYKSSHRH